MITEEKLRLMFEQLGDSADDIAAFFEGQGIKGLRRAGTACPTAVWLQRHGIHVLVGSDMALLDSGTRVGHPRALRDFIVQFDDGYYPILEASGIRK